MLLVYYLILIIKLFMLPILLCQFLSGKIGSVIGNRATGTDY